MDISVVIPCFNEEKNIGSCLESLIKQDYGGNYEVIAVDGGSEDRTQDIIKKFAYIDSRIRLIVERKRGTAAGRNAGIRAARHDYIGFIDADCEAPNGWLSLLVEKYRSAKSDFDGIVGVGGRNIAPENADNFIKAIEIVLDSYIGSFASIQGRQLKAPALVPSLSTVNALYDKKKIIEGGYFDESLRSEAEDADINYRLFSAGNRFLFVPASFVWHKMRANHIMWLKNMFRWGKGRARLLKRYSNMWNVSFLLPLFFILAMASVPLGVFFKIFYLPLLYFPFIALFSLYQCACKKALRLFFVVTSVYVIQHFGYACGEIYGLIDYKVK